MDTMKLLVVGYQKTGKTAILQSVNGNIDQDFRTYNVDFETTDNGNLRFVCSEASKIVITDICGYDGVMVVFDVMQMQSYKYMKTLCEELTRVDLNKPIVIVQNKCDRPKWKVKNIVADRYFDLLIYKISASAKTNVQKPFQCLARLIKKIPTLTFVEGADVPLPLPAIIANDEVVHVANAAEEVAHPSNASEEVVLPSSAADEVVKTPNAGDKAGHKSKTDGRKFNSVARADPPCSKTIRLDDYLDDFLKGQNPSRCFY